MTDRSIVGRFAEMATRAADRGLPEHVSAQVPKHILDIVGICVRASTLDTSDAVRRFAVEQSGAAQSSAVGLFELLPAPSAAFVNGVLAHSLDFDDTHLPSVLHPSASVVPAVLAVAELTGCPGSSVTAAVGVGLEVCIRLGMGGFDQDRGTSSFFDRGQHATSICGTVGAAAAAAMILGLDADRIASAMAISASMGSGIIEANRVGGTVKRVHCGWAAHSGIVAALLARNGITGPDTVFEGRFGFFQAWLSGEFDLAAVTEALGEIWLTTDIVMKPYPANHFTHPGIDAALALRSHGLDWRDVDSIELGVAEPVIRTIGEPIDVKRTPATGYMAQFSAPFTVAAALIGGGGLGVNLDDFTDTLANDPARRSLMQKVTVVADRAATLAFPRRFAATLRVTATDGTRWEQTVDASRGSRSNPMSYDEVAAKFRDNVNGLLTEADAGAIEEQIESLATLPDIRSILAPLRAVGAQRHD